MQFANLKGAEITPQSTSKFIFYDLQGEPWLMVKPATEHNKPYFNALLKKNAGSRRARLNKVIDAAAIERDRAEARELYTTHVTNVGIWGNWIDDAGAPIPYSPAAMASLLQSLPAEQFDQLRLYCAELANFRSDVVSADDAEDAGKNS